MGIKKRPGFLGVSIALSFVMAIFLPAGGYGPGTLAAWAAQKPEGMDDETWAKLMDNTMEYDELGALIENFNPTYQQIVDSLNAMAQPSYDAAQRLRDDAKVVADDAKEYKDKIDFQSMYTYMVLTEQARIERESAKTIESIGNKVNRNRDTIVLKYTTQKQLTNAAQQLFILYHQALASSELMNAATELAQAALQSYETQRSVGMATEFDVLSAQKALLSAQNQQLSLNDSLTTLRQNLCLLTGWAYNAVPEIGAVPAPDLTRIDAMNPDADLETAYNSNQDIYNQTRITSRDTVGLNRQERTMNDLRAQLKTTLESLYQTVIQNRTSYEAANTALEAASITMSGVERQYQMGMIGRLQYLQARIGYLQQKMMAENAALSLTQAMETYDWALKGIVTLE